MIPPSSRQPCAIARAALEPILAGHPRWVPALLAGLLVVAPGCQSMTSARRARLEAEAKAKDESARAEIEAKKRAAEQEARDAEAKKEYEKLVRKSDRETLKFEAVQELNSGNPEKALELVERIFKPLPEPRKDETTGEPVRGADGSVVVVVPPPPQMDKVEESRIHYLRGSILYRLDRKDESVAAFQKAVDLDPDYRPARRDFGKMLFIEKRYREALEVFQRELSQGYRDSEILFLIAQARYELGRAAGAAGKAGEQAAHLEISRLALEQSLVELLEKPREMEIKRWLSIVNYELGRHQEAIRLFEELRKENPLDPQYLEFLANCHIELDDYRKAVEYLELSAAIKAPSPQVSKTLGDLYEAIGQADRAAEWLVRSVGGEPDRATGSEKLEIGRGYFDAGRYEEAIRWLEAVPEGDKPYADARTELAVLHRERGELDAAAEAWEKVRAAKPGDCQINLTLGDIRLGQKKLDEAFEAYARATAIGDAACRAEGHAGLAEVAYEREQLDESVLQYKKAVELAPDSQRFKTALQQISDEAQYRKGLRADAVTQAP